VRWQAATSFSSRRRRAYADILGVLVFRARALRERGGGHGNAGSASRRWRHALDSAPDAMLTLEQGAQAVIKAERVNLPSGCLIEKDRVSVATTPP